MMAFERFVAERSRERWTAATVEEVATEATGWIGKGLVEIRV